MLGISAGLDPQAGEFPAGPERGLVLNLREQEKLKEMIIMRKIEIELTEEEIQGRVGKELQEVAEKTNTFFEIFLEEEDHWCMNENAPDDMKQFASRVKVGYITPEQIEIFTTQIADGPAGNGYYAVCDTCKNLYRKNTSLEARRCSSCVNEIKLGIREHHEKQG